MINEPIGNRATLVTPTVRVSASKIAKAKMSTQTLRSDMEISKVVSPQEWEAARQELLVKEKELTRARDALAAERRRMPWLAVEKEYEFEGPKGKAGLLDMFDGAGGSSGLGSWRLAYVLVPMIVEARVCFCPRSPGIFLADSID